MNDKLIVILATIPILICGILVLIGKGRFLIAGYNILSESKKNKYNIRKIETILGIWVIFFGLSLATILWFVHKIPPLIIVCFIVFTMFVSLILLTYVNNISTKE